MNAQNFKIVKILEMLFAFLSLYWQITSTTKNYHGESIKSRLKLKEFVFRCLDFPLIFNINTFFLCVRNLYTDPGNLILKEGPALILPNKKFKLIFAYVDVSRWDLGSGIIRGNVRGGPAGSTSGIFFRGGQAKVAAKGDGAVDSRRWARSGRRILLNCPGVISAEPALPGKRPGHFESLMHTSHTSGRRWRAGRRGHREDVGGRHFVFTHSSIIELALRTVSPLGILVFSSLFRLFLVLISSSSSWYGALVAAAARDFLFRRDDYRRSELVVIHLKNRFLMLPKSVINMVNFD